MMRRFYLKNEYGAQWNLNDQATGFLTSPNGLGYKMKTSYAEIGHSFIRNYMKEGQQEVTGVLVFGTAAPYLACNRFVNFVNEASELKLIYKTDVGEYQRDVDFVAFEKSEISRSGVLECPVSFSCKGLFYSNQINRFAVSRSEGELRWDFTWPARFNDYGYRKVLVNNNGHVPASFEMEIYGYCENPSAVITQNGAELYRVEFPTILEEGEKILHSSVDGNLYCIRVDAEGNEENFVDLLDINNANFFKFPVGESMIEFTSDTGASNQTILTLYKFYRMV